MIACARHVILTIVNYLPAVPPPTRSQHSKYSKSVELIKAYSDAKNGNYIC